jgi:hypothetical protein
MSESVIEVLNLCDNVNNSYIQKLINFITISNHPENPSNPTDLYSSAKLEDVDDDDDDDNITPLIMINETSAIGGGYGHNSIFHPSTLTSEW